MEILSRQLAERIVDRTMKAVNKNVNIMNEKGMIIASGDKSRVGTIHEGAVLALKRRSEFSIDEKQCKELNGVQEGTNIVIEFKENVIGVIGITGKRDEVIGYGRLIKMAAEMMIEQAYVMRELEWNNKIKENMIVSLINDDQGSFKLLEKYAKKFKLTNNYPMAVFIVQIDFEKISEKRDIDTLNNVISILEANFEGSPAAAIDSKTIVIIYKCPNMNYRPVTCKPRIEGVYRKISHKTKNNVKISMGKVYNKLTDICKSYEIAKKTLLFGRENYSQENVYIFDILKYQMLFLQDNARWKLNELKNSYELISKNDKNGELMETLKVFIEENGELNKVSNRLFIHRNTLNYRLNKIYKLTNLNPKRYVDLFWLYSSIINFKTAWN
ncbi:MULTISPECIES: sugar diacid recognition domain-containing protein [Clostridium]|uniref:Sugar diacid recognition domain-containing protein n=1 Tax=Clostridium lapidicellarium TaxID=3240931 RepID=A0ABV4DZX9_9CLOT